MKKALAFKGEKELNAEIKPLIEKVEKWASLGPLLQPYLALLYAELERVSGNFREARSLYLDAINAADEYGYIFLEGHLNECLGELLSEHNQPNARMFFGEAANLYRKCHAERKENRLLEKFSKYFEEEKAPYIQLEAEPSIRTLPDLDVEYLMKSALAISAEIEQQALLKKILNLVIESSGAQHGYLLTEQDRGLFVRAESHGSEREDVVICNKRLEDTKSICKAIVRYVHRTGQRIILNNASAEGDFKDNPEVQDMKLRSVLCLPIIKQTKNIGLLYLENNLADSVFTPGKTGMTEMLTLQAAISLENAALFDERRKTEETLKLSERGLSKSQEIAHLGSWELDLINNKLTWSNEVYRIFGLQPQQFAATYEAFLESVHPEDRKKVDDAYSGSLRMGKDTYEVEHRIVRKSNGEIRTVYEKCEHIRDSTGRIVRSVGMIHDITERKQAEEALKKSEQRWSTTLASVGDAVIAADTEGKITFMNTISEELTGWNLCEASGQPVKEVFKIVNEFSRKEVDDPVSKVLEKGMIVGLANHTVLIRKDGAEISIDDSGAPIRDDKGRITGVVLVFRDISERRQAEQEHERLSAIIESTDDAIIGKTLDGVITSWNGAAEKLYGYTADEMIGKHISTIIPQDRKEEFQHIMEKLQLGVKIEHHDTIRLRHDRSRLDVDVTVAPIKNAHGLIVGASTIARDITERKKAQLALWKATNDWERTFDSVPDLISILDENHQIIRANKAMAKALKTEPEKCIGLNCYKCVHGMDSPPSFCPHSKTLLDGKEHTEEVNEPGLGGYFLVSATPLIDDKGRLIGSVHVARDITARKEMENKLEEYSSHLEALVEERTKALKTAERMAAIGATAGMVGHDIRNPLQAITSDVFLARSELESLPDSGEKNNALESMNEIEKNIDYINKIVQDLQDYARPLNPRFEESDLEQVIQGVIKKSNHLPSNVKIKVLIADDARKIKADSYYLNRILYNLITNSIQAMPNGGRLSIRAFKDGGDTVFSVEDTGIGIPRDVQDKMFVLMFTTKSKGQGFGLPVVKRMAESLGGTVTFTSEEGKGTTFTVRLPHPKN